MAEDRAAETGAAFANEAIRHYLESRAWKDSQGNCSYCHCWQNHATNCPVYRAVRDAADPEDES